MGEADSLIEGAAALAGRAHAGQTDKAGRPYIEHPSRVAARVAERYPDNIVARGIAWLHDVVEDTDVTLEEIRAQFGPEVADGVDAITHRPGEPREDYYRRVAANPTALLVKGADLDDNGDPERLAMLDAATRVRLEAKYAKARTALGLL